MQAADSDEDMHAADERRASSQESSSERTPKPNSTAHDSDDVRPDGVMGTPGFRGIGHVSFNLDHADPARRHTYRAPCARTGPLPPPLPALA